MKKIIIFILFNLGFCILLAGGDISEAMDSDANSFWSLSVEKFKSTFNSGIYKWQPLQKTLIYEPGKDKDKLFFMGQEISKASFKFFQKHLQGMYLTFAMEENVSREDYLKKIDSLRSKMEAMDKFPSPKLTRRKSGLYYHCTCLLKSRAYIICLRWSYSRNPKAPFKTDSSKLSIFYEGEISTSASPEKTDSQETVNPDDKKTDSEPENVESGDVKSDNAKSGDVGKDKDDYILEVPMVVESTPEQSYQACVSRVIKFYSEKSAKKAGMSEKVGKGTESGHSKHHFLTEYEISYEIKKLLDKQPYSVRELIYPDCFEDFIKFKSLISIYTGYGGENKFKGQVFRVRRYKKRPKNTNFILMRVYSSSMPYEYLTNMIDIILMMNNKSAWKKARCRRDSEVQRFRKKVCAEILEGRPVLWDVIRGMVVEQNPPPVEGEYMRLIVGFNDKTEQVIYSDSRGKGHENKKMSWSDAWAATYKTMIIVPKRGL